MKAIVVCVMNVDGMHPFLEFLVGDDLADIFKNEHAGFELIAASYAPSLFFCHEALQTLSPAVALNPLVQTLVANWAHLTVALCIHHSVKAIIAATLSLDI